MKKRVGKMYFHQATGWFNYPFCMETTVYCISNGYKTPHIFLKRSGDAERHYRRAIASEFHENSTQLMMLSTGDMLSWPKMNLGAGVRLYTAWPWVWFQLKERLNETRRAQLPD